VTSIFLYEHVTAVGTRDSSLYREGRAMRDAIAADLLAIPGIDVHILESASVDEFKKRAQRSDWSLIIAPETDGILETCCTRVQKAGGRLLGPSPEAIRLAADKWALARHFNEHGIPTPRSVRLGDESLAYPFVLKPRDGAGSQSTYLVTDKASEQAALSQVDAANTLTQEFSLGNAGSVAVLCGPGETRAMQPCSQRLSADGRFQYEGGQTPIRHADRAASLAVRAVRTVDGLLGYVGVDLVLGEHDVVIEINPRLTTSYIGLRQAADFNIAEAMLQIAEGRPVPAMRWHNELIHFVA